MWFDVVIVVLILVSIVASISAPIVIYIMQFKFMKRMKVELSQATVEAKQELVGMLQDPATYDYIVGRIKAEVEENFETYVNNIYENLERLVESINTSLSLLPRYMFDSVKGMYGGVMKNLEFSADDMADIPIPVLGVEFLFGTKTRRKGIFKSLVYRAATALTADKNKTPEGAIVVKARELPPPPDD